MTATAEFTEKNEIRQNLLNKIHQFMHVVQAYIIDYIRFRDYQRLTSKIKISLLSLTEIRREREI